MRRRLPSRKLLRHLCAEPDATDGVDPRYETQGAARKRSDRKLRQLCSQVAETLAYGLSSGGADESLSRVQVLSIAPAPHAGRLLVTVGPLPSERPDPAVVLEALQQAAPALRTTVAAAITRRRAPLLTFRFAIPGPDDSSAL